MAKNEKSTAKPEAAEALEKVLVRERDARRLLLDDKLEELRRLRAERGIVGSAVGDRG